MIYSRRATSGASSSLLPSTTPVATTNVLWDCGSDPHGRPPTLDSWVARRNTEQMLWGTPQHLPQEHRGCVKYHCALWEDGCPSSVAMRLLLAEDWLAAEWCGGTRNQQNVTTRATTTTTTSTSCPSKDGYSYMAHSQAQMASSPDWRLSFVFRVGTTDALG
jgi:hypothetical protein